MVIKIIDNRLDKSKYEFLNDNEYNIINNSVIIFKDIRKISNKLYLKVDCTDNSIYKEYITIILRIENKLNRVLQYIKIYNHSMYIVFNYY